VFGDTVYVRFAAADETEFAGSVIATESTRCMLAMPKLFYSCCGVDLSGATNALQVTPPLPPPLPPTYTPPFSGGLDIKALAKCRAEYMSFVG